MEVAIARPDDPISKVLEHVRHFDYSQLPVYDDGRYIALLTTNAIARWLANQLATNAGLAEEERVVRVLEFAEPYEQAVLLPRALTAAEAIDRLSRGGPGGRPAAALIITDSGKATEKPLAVIVADDLPRLAAALALA
jgi:CBS domain-containing protein